MTFEELNDTTLERLLHDYSDALNTLKDSQNRWKEACRDLRKLLRYDNQDKEYKESHSTYVHPEKILPINYLRTIYQTNCRVLKNCVYLSQKRVNDILKLIRTKISLMGR